METITDRDEPVVPFAVEENRKKLENLIAKNGIAEVLRWTLAGRNGKSDNSGVMIGTTPEETKLRQWWSDTSRADCERVIPKALEYSSIDLTTIGAGLPGVLPDDQVRTEAGIAFYLLGKCARLTGAYGEGRGPSDDSWHDVSVYSYMGRHVRKFGKWGMSR